MGGVCHDISTDSLYESGWWAVKPLALAYVSIRISWAAFGHCLELLVKNLVDGWTLPNSSFCEQAT